LILLIDSSTWGFSSNGCDGLCTADVLFPDVLAMRGGTLDRIAGARTEERVKSVPRP